MCYMKIKDRIWKRPERSVFLKLSHIQRILNSQETQKLIRNTNTKHASLRSLHGGCFPTHQTWTPTVYKKISQWIRKLSVTSNFLLTVPRDTWASVLIHTSALSRSTSGAVKKSSLLWCCGRSWLNAYLLSASCSKRRVVVG